MADTTHEVEVVLSMKDLASATAAQVAAAAGKIGTAFDNASMRLASFAKTMGPLAGLFGFGASIAGAKRYMQTIEELNTITNAGVENVVGMTHAMEQSGLRAEETRAVMISMARKQAELAAGSQEVAKLAKKYGVELKKGPEAALVSMSKQMQAGKIGTGEVVKLLEESGAKAVDLLRKGPAEVQRLFAEGRKKNLHVNEQTVAQYKQLDIQMTRIKQAWTRVTSTILVKLAPVLTNMLRFMETRIDGWVSGAQRFGSYMAENMDSIIYNARLFGKIMLANAALVKFTGKGLGARAAGMFGKSSAGESGGLLATGGVASIAKLIGKFTIAGAAAAAISGALKAAWDSSKALRDNLRSAFGDAAKHAKAIWGAILDAFGPKSPLGQLLRWIGTGMIKAFTAAVSAVGKILHFFRVMGVMIKSALEGELIGYSAAAERIRKTEAAEKATGIRDLGTQYKVTAINLKRLNAHFERTKGAAPSAMQMDIGRRILTSAQQKGMPVDPALLRRYGLAEGKARPMMVQDFRNSKFEIIQQFAEGYDPERLAVIFSNDLANLGERRLASGQNPQGTIR